MYLVGSSTYARLMYLAQQRHVSQQGVYMQRTVPPILAPPLQAPVRVFVLCECRSHVFLARVDQSYHQSKQGLLTKVC